MMVKLGHQTSDGSAELAQASAQHCYTTVLIHASVCDMQSAVISC